MEGNVSTRSTQELNETALAVFTEVSGINRLMDKRLQGAFCELEVHPAQYGCLFIICKNPGLNLRELAERLQIENSTASVSVKRMEKAGYLRREADAGDCRMTRLYPTARGRAQFERSKRIIQDFISQCFVSLGASELFQLQELLEKIKRGLEEYRPRGNDKKEGDSP
jgi:DNA-binding MarR family transcriptional regulator